MGIHSAPSRPCCPSLDLGLADTHRPSAKAPASSLSHSAPAASPDPGSLSTALVLKMGTEESALQVWAAVGRRGALGMDYLEG